MAQLEQWRDVDGFDGRFQVSDLGKVRNTVRGNFLTGKLTKSGVVVCLRRPDGGATTRLLHVMVSTAFRGPAPDGLCVRQKNADKLDCRLDNLEWRERKKFSPPPHGHRRGQECSFAKLTESDVRQIRHLRTKGVSFTLLAEHFKVTVSTVHAAAVGRTWRHVV